jgi:hypothetical protein
VSAHCDRDPASVQWMREHAPSSAELPPAERAAFDRWARNGDPRAAVEDREHRELVLAANDKYRQRVRRAIANPTRCSDEPIGRGDPAREVAHVRNHWQVHPWPRLSASERDEVHARLEELTAARCRNVARPRPSKPSNAYVAALVEGCYSDVVNADHGIRNNILSRSSFRFGQCVGAGLLDETCAFAALEEAAERCDLPRREALSIIRAGLRAGARHPLETK